MHLLLCAGQNSIIKLIYRNVINSNFLIRDRNEEKLFLDDTRYWLKVAITNSSEHYIKFFSPFNYYYDEYAWYTGITVFFLRNVVQILYNCNDNKSLCTYLTILSKTITYVLFSLIEIQSLVSLFAKAKYFCQYVKLINSPNFNPLICTFYQDYRCK